MFGWKTRYLWERSCLSLGCCSGGVLPIRHGGSEGRQAKEAELDNSFFAPVTGSELLNKQVWMQQARRRQGKNTESICAWVWPLTLAQSSQGWARSCHCRAGRCWNASHPPPSKCKASSNPGSKTSSGSKSRGKTQKQIPFPAWH